ncbi:MAG TPA: hypothetical protein VMV69_26775 [Pirellulales bacterium]|nr:hypothetical protein [Pirellulales bacterium]
MSATRTALKGVIHGKTIELEVEPGLPEGHEVAVIWRPVPLPVEGSAPAAVNVSFSTA